MLMFCSSKSRVLKRKNSRAYVPERRGLYKRIDAYMMMLNAALVLAFLVSGYAFPVIPDRPFSGHFPTAHFNSTGDVIPGEFIVTIAPGSDLQQSISAVSRRAESARA